MAQLSDRFLAKVQEIPEMGCWVWTAGRDKDGYGRFTIDSRSRLAHRVSYEAKFGLIPDGLVIDHLCRETSCVNPDHLRAVTNWENLMAEGSRAPAKLQAERDNCERCGSAYSDLGYQRACRKCRTARDRVYNKRRALARRAALTTTATAGV